jgi:trigger factor
METKVEKLKQCRVRTTTTLTKDEVLHAEERALAKLGEQISIKGFRQGKVPLSLLRERVKEEELLEETVRMLLPTIIPEALKISAVKPILRPSAGVTAKDPLTITLTFVEHPTVIVRKPDNIAVEKKTVPPVSNDEVEGFLKKVLLQDRTETPVDRGAAKGDTIRLSLAAKDDQGKPVAELTIGHYNIVLGAEELLPELEPHLLGMKKGGQKTVTVAFSPSHDITAIRGKRLNIDLTAKEVAEIKLPELTTEYLRTRFHADRTPEAFREDVRKMLFDQRKGQEKKRREEELYKKVREMTTVDLAPELIDAEVQDMVTDLVERLKQQQMTIENWLKTTGKEWKTFLEEMKNIGTERLTLRYGMQELAQKRKIEPTAAELQTHIDAIRKAQEQSGRTLSAEDTAPGSYIAEQASWELRMQKLVENLIQD